MITAGMFDDPYFNSKRAGFTFFGVLLVHICIVVVPLIYSSLMDYFDPPVMVMKVGLVDLPLGDSPDAGATASTDIPASAETDLPADLPPDPTHVDPLPDLPPDPPPPPKTDPVKTDVKPPKADPVKPDVKPPKTDPVKPNVKPPKTDPVKTDVKPTKTDPPKSTLLSAKDINVTRTTKSQAQIDAERKAQREAEARAKADAQAREQLLADLRNAAGTKPGTYGTTDPGRQGILASKEMRDYYEQLNAFIRPKWNAVSPSSIELSGKISNWPSVDLTIAKDGRVTKAVIVSASGNKAIDAAVKTLLEDLKVVPVPPQAAVIRVTLDIR